MKNFSNNFFQPFLTLINGIFILFNVRLSAFLDYPTLLKVEDSDVIWLIDLTVNQLVINGVVNLLGFLWNKFFYLSMRVEMLNKSDGLYFLSQDQQYEFKLVLKGQEKKDKFVRLNKNKDFTVQVSDPFKADFIVNLRDSILVPINEGLQREINFTVSPSGYYTNFKTSLIIEVVNSRGKRSWPFLRKAISVELEG